MGMEVLEICHDSELARRGNSALDLVQRLAATIASTQARHEQQLQKALADVTAAENLGAVLSERACRAEERADEAEQWLRRLHSRLQEEFASAKQVSMRA